MKPVFLFSWRQIYIIGGFVDSSALNMIEVLDTDLDTVTPLLGSDGLPMTQPSFFNNRKSCAVGFDESNYIVISGGNKDGT